MYKFARKDLRKVWGGATLACYEDPKEEDWRDEESACLRQSMFMLDLRREMSKRKRMQ